MSDKTPNEKILSKKPKSGGTPKAITSKGEVQRKKVLGSRKDAQSTDSNNK